MFMNIIAWGPQVKVKAASVPGWETLEKLFSGVKSPGTDRIVYILKAGFSYM